MATEPVTSSYSIQACSNLPSNWAQNRIKPTQHRSALGASAHLFPYRHPELQAGGEAGVCVPSMSVSSMCVYLWVCVCPLYKCVQYVYEGQSAGASGFSDLHRWPGRGRCLYCGLCSPSAACCRGQEGTVHSSSSWCLGTYPADCLAPHIWS